MKSGSSSGGGGAEAQCTGSKPAGVKRGQVPAASSLPPEDRGGRGEQEEEGGGGGRASGPVSETHFHGFSPPPLSVQLDSTAGHALACSRARPPPSLESLESLGLLFPRAAPPPCRGSAIKLKEGERSERSEGGWGVHRRCGWRCHCAGQRKKKIKQN